MFENISKVFKAATQFRTITVCVMAALITGCSLFDSSTEYGAIAGYVVDSSDGTPIAGARITMIPGGGSDKTNEKGRFSISSISAGSYTVAASKQGYVNKTVHVFVEAGQTAIADMALVSKG